MASTVKFAANNVAVYGALQASEGVPETLSQANALAALTLTYDENISSSEEQYLGNITQRDTLVSINDRFAEVKIDTALPRLGSLFGRPINATEQAQLQFIDTIASGTIIFAGATMTVGSSATPEELAEELLAYLNGGSATQNHSTFTGTPNADYNYTLNGNDITIILAESLTTNTNVTDLTLGGTQAAKATLVIGQGMAGAELPIMPFMESSKFHAIIEGSLSITDALNSKFVDAESQLQKAITENSWADNALLNAKRAAQKLDLLDLGATGNSAVDALITNLDTCRVETAAIATDVAATITGIEDLWHTMRVNLITDPTGADLVTDLKTDSAAVKVLINAVDEATLNATLDIALVDALVNSNTAVEDQFITLSDRVRDFYLKAIEHSGNLTALIESGGLDAETLLEAADTTIQNVGFTTASLVPVVIKVSFTNEFSSNDTLTLNVRKSSADMVGEQKNVIITDAVATLDLNIEVGQRPKVTFNYHGNVYDVVNSSELAYPISVQKADAAYVTKAENVRQASLTPTGDGLINNNICVSKITATNIDGYEHQRIMTGCSDSWQTVAKAGKVTVTILEAEANTDMNTQFNVEDNVGNEFYLTFQQDGTSGNTIDVVLTKLILTSYKHTTVQNRAAQDLEFTYSGFGTIALS